MPMGAEPGTVALFEPEVASIEGGSMDAHSMNPAVVLALLSDLGGHVERVLVVGCEPLTVEEGIGLSAPVTAAVEPAEEAILLPELTAA